MTLLLVLYFLVLEGVSYFEYFRFHMVQVHVQHLVQMSTLSVLEDIPDFCTDLANSQITDSCLTDKCFEMKSRCSNVLSNSLQNPSDSSTRN